MGHLLVREEVGAFHLTFWSHHTGEHVGIEFMLHAIPEEFLAGVDKAIDIADTNTPSQVPEFLLVEIPGCVGLDISLNMKLLVELFTWNFSSNCSKKTPFSKVQRVGCRTVFTSQRSVTIRYLMTPESLMRVFTP